MAEGFFITGTDTGIGKTWSSIALLHYFRQQGKSVLGMKPVASGCEAINGRLRNEDALLLQQHASHSAEYALINPYAFAQPVSPHIAANCSGQQINLQEIRRCYTILRKKADLVIVEGVGGWRVPLAEHLDVADLAVSLKLPVIVVVGIRLGCINHAKLTLQAVTASGLSCAGWVASCVEPDMMAREENIKTIERMTEAPLLGVLPYLENPDFEFFAGLLKEGIKKITISRHNSPLL